MSTAAKATFVTTSICSAAVVYSVVRLQENEREALHQGPIKDRERQRLRKEAANAKNPGVDLTPVQERRAAEYELQKQLREEYSKIQQVTGKDQSN